MSECDTLGDTALQAVNAYFEKSLLMLIDGVEDIKGFLGTVGLQAVSPIHKLNRGEGYTYTKFNGNGEEITASLLSYTLTTWNSRKVDKGWLNDSLLAIYGL